MRRAGMLASYILDYITPYIRSKITTERLNFLCHNKIIMGNAQSAPLKYKNFPKSICASVQG